MCGALIEIWAGRRRKSLTCEVAKSIYLYQLLFVVPIMVTKNAGLMFCLSMYAWSFRLSYL
jgi:hypothetical protein